MSKIDTTLSEQTVFQKRLSSVAESTLETIKLLFDMLQLRDKVTAKHSLSMAELSYQLAKECDNRNAMLYYLGSLTHDIGKIGMHDKILKSNKALSPQERKSLHAHVEDGYNLLKKLNLPQVILDISLYHHERYDGSGYLLGLQGKEIPLAGRIAAITDTYSALTTNRPYQRALNKQDALNIITKDSHMFDPEVLSIFLKLREREK
ncbi:HD-GYP domain-containing protein [Paenibacillus gansuensis]|uniref:HD-GYP domain-containing protein n=1 Tax=Paenibacillus gansuensis TaxID=306542 RepID=A0ABW5PJB6_9BACL